jgi:hypothetical protein
MCHLHPWQDKPCIFICMVYLYTWHVYLCVCMYVHVCMDKPTCPGQICRSQHPFSMLGSFFTLTASIRSYDTFIFWSKVSSLSLLSFLQTSELHLDDFCSYCWWRVEQRLALLVSFVLTWAMCGCTNDRLYMWLALAHQEAVCMHCQG